MSSYFPFLAQAGQDQRDGEINTLIPLPDYRVIRVFGEQAEKMLQGQCTCDFSELSDESFLRGAHCNPKGRMVFNFVAARLDEHSIGLRVRESCTELALSALSKYAGFFKVQLETLQDWTLFAHSDPSHTHDEGAVFRRDHNLVLKHAWGYCEHWCENPYLEPSLKSLEWDSLQATDARWTLFQVKAGIVDIEAHQSEQLLPQEINFPEIGGVNFKKGCYTGQEVVARLHYRGQLKKQMFLASAISDHLPKAGENILIGEKAAGRTIASAKDDDDKVWALILCSQETTQRRDVVFAGNPAHLLTWESLPYAIP